jgi:DNA-directed RNA polymerase subunit H (RpoH/RPB5)
MQMPLVSKFLCWLNPRDVIVKKNVPVDTASTGPAEKNKILARLPTVKQNLPWLHEKDKIIITKQY